MSKQAPPPTGIARRSEAIGRKVRLEYGKTGPLSYLELRKTPVGESVDPEARRQLSQLLFGSKDLGAVSADLDVSILLGNRYLSMKTQRHALPHADAGRGPRRGGPRLETAEGGASWP